MLACPDGLGLYDSALRFFCTLPLWRIGVQVPPHFTSSQSTCGLQPQGACKLRKMKPQVGGSRRAATVVCKSPAGKRQTLDVEFGRCIELDCAVRTLAPANERTHHELSHQPAISARRAPHDPGATRYVARGVPPIRHQMGGRKVLSGDGQAHQDVPDSSNARWTIW